MRRTGGTGQPRVFQTRGALRIQTAPLPTALNLTDAAWTRANQKFWGSLR
jgi:hypothetical protein